MRDISKTLKSFNIDRNKHAQLLRLAELLSTSASPLAEEALDMLLEKYAYVFDPDWDGKIEIQVDLDPAIMNDYEIVAQAIKTDVPALAARVLQYKTEESNGKERGPLFTDTEYRALLERVSAILEQEEHSDISRYELKVLSVQIVLHELHNAPELPSDPLDYTNFYWEQRKRLAIVTILDHQQAIKVLEDFIKREADRDDHTSPYTADALAKAIEDYERVYHPIAPAAAAAG